MSFSSLSILPPVGRDLSLPDCMAPLSPLAFPMLLAPWSPPPNNEQKSHRRTGSSSSTSSMASNDSCSMTTGDERIPPSPPRRARFIELPAVGGEPDIDITHCLPEDEPMDVDAPFFANAT